MRLPTVVVENPKAETNVVLKSFCELSRANGRLSSGRTEDVLVLAETDREFVFVAVPSRRVFISLILSESVLIFSFPSEVLEEEQLTQSDNSFSYRSKRAWRLDGDGVAPVAMGNEDDPIAMVMLSSRKVYSHDV
ncbi:hypothetical protein CCP3SC15_1640005 [Gammaproteobacteria bacterium]